MANIVLNSQSLNLIANLPSLGSLWSKKTLNLNSLTLKSSEKLNFVSNLATMISAGIPILSAINSLSKDANGSMKIVLDTIRDDLLQGKRLHTSFTKFPRVFDTVTVNMMKAAEESGNLDIVLNDLREQIKKDIALNRKLKSVLTYPITVLIVFFAVLFVILVVVIPKISIIFSQLKVHMPLATRILIGASYILLHYTILVIIGLGLIIAGLVLLYKRERKRIITFLSSLPVISSLIKELDLLRFTRSIHLLLTSGITIVTALELTENIVVRPEIRKAIIDAKHTIYGGQLLSHSFKKSDKIFQGTVLELTRAGETTGSLDKTFHHLSEYFDGRVTEKLGLLAVILEPVMLILVAILVGAMMIAVIGPLYSLIGQISP